MEGNSSFQNSTFQYQDHISCSQLKLYHISLLCLKIHQISPETATEIIRAMGNPTFNCSMPFIRFIPKRLAMSVGNIMRMETEVNVRITLFMLLLMMLE